MNTKQKGNLLEGIVEYLCLGIKNAKVSKNTKISGKRSGEMMEVSFVSFSFQGCDRGASNPAHGRIQKSLIIPYN